MTMTSIYDYCASPSPSACTEVHWEEASEALDKLYDPLFSIRPEHSERFWFEDGTAVVQVQKTLYKLYKGVLARQSNYFKNNLSVTLQSPASTGKKKGIARYGTPRLVGIGSEDTPLVLQVKKDDFEILLSYLFPENYNFQYCFTMKEWSAIASISKKLEMDTVREAAVSNILKLADALDLIDIGPKHDIPECYLEGFRRLCVREESMSLEEGERLGLATVIAIAHSRDMLANGSKWSELEFSVEFKSSK